jgi:hypothetical protein
VHVARCGDANHLGSMLHFHPKRKRPLTMPESSFEELIEAMKAAAGILNDAGIEFVLGGGLSAWARGGPRSEHDVDFLIKPDDAEPALQAFDDAGWKTEKPPEGWLYKTWHENGALVDLIFDPASGPITQEIIDRSHEGEVMALRAKVATLEDVLVSKLMAIKEQELNFSSVLEWSRALREQIDWAEVRDRTQGSPFAKAFFVLLEELDIVERIPT